MKINRAAHLGMCFGVRDAIALAKGEAQNRPLTIFGDLVHNDAVLADLRANGVQIQNRLEEITTAAVMITAHGASERTLDRVRQQGHELIEATCPLVHYAHRSLTKLVQAGCHPIIIGKRDHVEVRGLIEDFAEYDVVLTLDDITKVRERSRFGVISQTTQPIEKVHHLVASIRQTFRSSSVHFIDTVCQPTKQRQSAAAELAQRSDVVVVIGGANSNNTRELVATSLRYCARVHHVQSATDLCSEWFHGVQTVGITAGTSTPDSVIDEVEQRLLQLERAAA